MCKTNKEENNNPENTSPTMKKESGQKNCNAAMENGETGGYTNEYVLNFAFFSFLGFTMLQFIFALAAKSQSMLTDCAAMTVDCITYLFNWWAEHLKHAEFESGSSLSAYERSFRRKLRLLLLELAPPFISVSTLVVVTIMALTQAIETLMVKDANQSASEQPDLFLMLLFSGINFVLDGVNVLCFAKADQAKGLSEGMTAAMHPQTYVEGTNPEAIETGNIDNEATHLLAQEQKQQQNLTMGNAQNITDDSDDDYESVDEPKKGLNLNMCSAWTHICADTLRSIAVLIAAGFAQIFPSLLSPADADSYGAIVVSLIIIISLGPLFEGLYFTAWDIYRLVQERRERRQRTRSQRESSRMSENV